MLFLTYAQPRAQQIVAALASENIQACNLSFQHILQTPKQESDCQALVHNLAQFDTIVFVSPNAIDSFFEANQGQQPLQTSALFKPNQVIVVGPGSQAALNHWLAKGGQQMVAEPPSTGQDSKIVRTFDANGVLEQLLALADSRAKQGSGIETSVLVVKGSAGRVDWIAQARQSGLTVQELQAYTALECTPDHQAADALVDCKRQNLWPVLVFSSTANVSRLVLWANALDQDDARTNTAQASSKLSLWLQQQTALAIHPRIAEQLKVMSFADVKEIAPGFDALRAAALKYGSR